MYAIRVYFFNLKRIFKNYLGLEALNFFFVYSAYALKYNFLCRLMRINITAENVFGRKVSFFNYKDFIGLFEEIFIGREYYFECAGNSPYIIDFGSNIGMSVIYFKWLYPGAVISAVEADPATFAMLKKNVEANGIKGVTLLNNAVYDRLTTVKFYFEASKKGSLQMSMSAARGTSRSFNRVKTIVASSLIKNNIDMVKMDIEGAEWVVMHEMAKKGVLKRISRFAMEVHHNMEGSPEILSGILGIFSKNKFKFQIFAPNNPPYFERKFQDVMVYAERENKNLQKGERRK
jgi:FkbM family methyltransferase